MDMNPVKIHAIGLDDRGLKIIKFFIQKFCKDRCKIVSEDQAEVFMINMDSVGAKRQLERIKMSTDRSPIILMALYALDAAPHYFIRKPLIANHFEALLTEIKALPNRKIPTELSKEADILQQGNTALAAEVHKNLDKPTASLLATDANSVASHAAHAEQQNRIDEFIGENRDIDLSGANPDIYFNPNDYYLGYIHQSVKLARRNNHAMKLSGLWHTVVVCPKNNLIYVETSDAKLRSFSIAVLEQSHKERAVIEKTDFDCDELDDIKIQDTFSSNKERRKNVQDIDIFLWKLSLWTSRGRIPEKTSLRQTVQLNSWPNFTRTVLTPYAMRITAYWQAKPRSLLETIDDLEVEQRYVFSLFTAMATLNHLEMSGSEVKQKTNIPKDIDSKQTSKTRQLLGKVMMKLRFAK